MADYIDMYLEITEQFKLIIEKSLSKDNVTKHAQLASFYDDYERLMHLDKGDIGVIYSEANAEYRTMLLFLCMGLYKNAYMSLRGYFELSLFGILVSASDISFRKWKNEKKDVRWCEITNEADGIFSSDFVEAYFPEVKEYREDMNDLAKKLYRICSEYIHSGYQVSAADEKTEFNQTTYDTFCENVKMINRIITYAFLVRYGDKIVNDPGKEDFLAVVDEYIPELNKIIN